MLPIFRVKFYAMSKFLLTDVISTVIKSHHRISRLEGAFTVEHLHNSFWEQLNKGWPSFCSGIGNGCNFQDCGGWWMGRRSTREVCCWVKIKWCAWSLLSQFVSMTANMVLSQRLELLVLVSFCCQPCQNSMAYKLQFECLWWIQDDQRLFWNSSHWEWESVALPFESGWPLCLLWLIELNSSGVVPFSGIV